MAAGHFAAVRRRRRRAVAIRANLARQRDDLRLEARHIDIRGILAVTLFHPLLVQLQVAGGRTPWRFRLSLTQPSGQPSSARIGRPDVA